MTEEGILVAIVAAILAASTAVYFWIRRSQQDGVTTDVNDGICCCFWEYTSTEEDAVPDRYCQICCFLFKRPVKVLERACRTVERNAPPIEEISVCEEIDMVNMIRFSGGVILSHSSYNDFVTNEQNGEDVSRFFHPKFYANWTEWRRLGRAVNSNPTIRCLTIRNDPHRFLNDHRFVEQRARCLEAFYTELKNNKTIEQLHFLHIGDFSRSSSLGLISFLQNNTNLKNLTIDGYLSPNHIDVLTPVLPKLETLTLWLNPNTATVLAALDPRAKLQHLYLIEFQDIPDAREILASLVRNTKLRSLKLGFKRSTQWSDVYIHNAFEKVLCDYSSLENICNSNHTLETVFRGGTPLPTSVISTY